MRPGILLVAKGEWDVKEEAGKDLSTRREERALCVRRQ